MKINKIILAVLASASLLGAVSCNKENGIGGGPSDAGFFASQAMAYNLTQEPVVKASVVRLGTSGDLTVSLSSSGASVFTVPTSVTIKDGDRMGEFEIAYNPSDLTFNELYEIQVKIGNFTSIYGYETVALTLEMPTSYREFGKGTIMEDWWGEQEDKTLYVRDLAADVLQCYLPDCWGHDSGPDYDVKDYVFYWNTKTNKLYIPLQLMGTEDWSIADRGAIACQFGGPNHKVGSAAWMSFIDDYYATAGFSQPHYDPATKKFYLSDTAAVSPADGSVVYGTPGAPDIFTLE